MVRREQGWSFRGPQDDLWRLEKDHMGEPLCDLIATAKILALTSAFSYINFATGEQQFEQPQEFRGGIIGDQMGLGKSLTTIALIAREKDELDCNVLLDSRFDVQSTLIIVRAPRESGSVTYQNCILLTKTSQWYKLGKISYNCEPPRPHINMC